MRERSAVKVARSVPRRGSLCKGAPLFCVSMHDFLTLVVSPLIVALVTTLVDHWLDDRDGN
ncbi:MAG: type I toxin-antitoxin system Fst family toxin [Enterococcus sp.]